MHSYSFIAFIWYMVAIGRNKTKFHGLTNFMRLFIIKI